MNAAIRALYDSSNVGLADHAFELNNAGNAKKVTYDEFVSQSRSKMEWQTVF